MKDLSSLSKLLLNHEKPVLLLEGTRKISPAEFTRLVHFGEFIARQFPNSIFRSDNASGSDDAFAQGVRKVAPDRMQIELPKTDSGKSRLHSSDSVLALEDVTVAEE